MLLAFLAHFSDIFFRVLVSADHHHRLPLITRMHRWRSCASAVSCYDLHNGNRDRSNCCAID
jgi:hypothetical protein